MKGEVEKGREKMNDGLKHTRNLKLGEYYYLEWVGTRWRIIQNTFTGAFAFTKASEKPINRQESLNGDDRKRSSRRREDYSHRHKHQHKQRN